MSLPEKKWLTLDNVAYRLGCNSYKDILRFGGERRLEIYLQAENLWAAEIPTTIAKWCKEKQLYDFNTACNYSKEIEWDIENLIKIHQIRFIRIDPETLLDMFYAPSIGPDKLCPMKYKSELIFRNEPSNIIHSEPLVIVHKANPFSVFNILSAKPVSFRKPRMYPLSMFAPLASVEMFEIEFNLNQSATIEPTQENKSPIKWKSYSLEIGKEINKDKPHLNKNKVAQKIHARFLNEKIQGRTGIPTAENIEREGLKNWSIWKIN